MPKILGPATGTRGRWPGRPLGNGVIPGTGSPFVLGPARGPTGKLAQAPAIDAGRLTVWVPVRVVNGAQTAGVHWGPKARRARVHRDTVALGVYLALGNAWRITAPATRPKAVTFTVYHPPPPFDDDGLPAACKHLRDGLQDCGLIQGDAPRHGHQFTYAQVCTRQVRGVAITVTLRP